MRRKHEKFKAVLCISIVMLNIYNGQTAYQECSVEMNNGQCSWGNSDACNGIADPIIDRVKCEVIMSRVAGCCLAYQSSEALCLNVSRMAENNACVIYPIKEKAEKCHRPAEYPRHGHASNSTCRPWFGQLLSAHQTPSELSCIDTCFRKSRCVAYNFDSKQQQCELLESVEMRLAVCRGGVVARMLDRDVFVKAHLDPSGTCQNGGRKLEVGT